MHWQKVGSPVSALWAACCGQGHSSSWDTDNRRWLKLSMATADIVGSVNTSSLATELLRLPSLTPPLLRLVSRESRFLKTSTACEFRRLLPVIWNSGSPLLSRLATPESCVAAFFFRCSQRRKFSWIQSTVNDISVFLLCFSNHMTFHFHFFLVTR